MHIGKCLSDAGPIQNGLIKKNKILFTNAFTLWFRIYYCESASRQCIP